MFLGYCYFMLSVPVQFIACEDRPQNDLLCIERDVKHLITHSLQPEKWPLSSVNVHMCDSY